METAGIHPRVIVGVAMLFDDSGLLGRFLRNTFLRNIANDLCIVLCILFTEECLNPAALGRANPCLLGLLHFGAAAKPGCVG